MTNEELQDYVRRARNIAQDAGPMHAQWDTILDAEAILAGRMPLLDRQTVECILRDWLDGTHA